MKRIISLLLLICLCFSVSSMLTACEQPKEHSHTYSKEWKKDSTHHWHSCEDTECDMISDKAEHSFIDDVCICGYEQTQTHTCVFDTEWSKDETDHWHICKSGDCEAIADKSAHIWNLGTITTPATKEDDGVKEFSCTTCGQTKIESIKYDPWAAYFDFEGMKNVTVTSKLTDLTNNQETNESLKIDNERWERQLADYSYGFKYYEKCTVYFDGENKYLNSEKSDCPVFKLAFFSFIDFSDRADLFSSAGQNRYEMGENTFELYGFTISNVVIIIENDCLKSISMDMTMGNTSQTFEYNFFDWGTTVIEKIASNND